MSNVHPLGEKSITVPYLLAQIGEGSEIDGLVCVVRMDGKWQTCWSTGVDLGSLSMATMKLLSDVTDEMHRPSHEPREFGSAG